MTPFPAVLPKQGVAPRVFGDVTWVSGHKLSYQNQLTCAATVAITKLLPCSSCRTSISLFSQNVMNPVNASEQAVWWITAHRFVSAKLGKPIPTKSQLAELAQKWQTSAFEEVFAMMAFFIQHFGLNKDLQDLERELAAQEDVKVRALATAGNLTELVSVFNREAHLSLPEHLVVWVIEGARSISR